MTAYVIHRPDSSWFESSLTPSAFEMSHPVASDVSGSSSRKRSKMDVCSNFLSKLRERHMLDVTDELVQGVEHHFNSLPSRYAYDVNIDSLDVLNHKRLLDSARGDPSAVSFQVRKVDILSAVTGKVGVDKGPSFGSSEALLEVSKIIQAPFPSYC